MKVVTGIFFAAAILAARATDIVTIHGTKHRDCDVMQVEPDGLLVRYTNGLAGGAKIKFRDLGPDLQRQYGYDPAKAAAFEQEQAARNARAEELEREAARLAALHAKTNTVKTLATTNTPATNSLASSTQPRQQVQHHPQHYVRPRTYTVHPPVHTPPPAVHTSPPAQHHGPTHGKTQAVAAQETDSRKRGARNA